jgi:hypothetical protein
MKSVAVIPLEYGILSAVQGFSSILRNLEAHCFVHISQQLVLILSMDVW